MNVATSVLLPEDLLAEIDERARQRAVNRDAQNEADLEILNRIADRLNLEVEDTLSYQVIP